MPDSPPPPPDRIPDDLVDILDDHPPDVLRAVASYADTLADHGLEAAAEGAAGHESDDQSAEDSRTATSEKGETPEAGSPEPDRPTGVPAKASITVKEINDNRYRYWQWRDGDSIKSKYVGPAGDGE